MGKEEEEDLVGGCERVWWEIYWWEELIGVVMSEKVD